MKLRKGEQIEVDIKSIAFKGKGVAKFSRPDDSEKREMTVFVNGVVAGDRVLAQIYQVKKRYAEARLIKILEPSKDRIEPKCKHFEACGGCTFQNITYENQLKIKKQFVIDAFERLGGFVNPPIQDPVTLSILPSNSSDKSSTDTTWFYRNKMELSFGLDEKGDFGLGLHVSGRRYDVFQMEECFLESEFLPILAKSVAEFMKSRGIKAVNSRNVGDLFTLTVREGKNTGERLVNLTTSSGPYDWLGEFVALLKGFEKDISSAFWTEKIIKKGQRTKQVEHHLFGKEILHEKLTVLGKEYVFSIQPEAFFQPNTLGAQLLYSEVLRQADPKNTKLAFDLFCGTGTIGMILASTTKKVISVELNKSAVESARYNANLNSIENVQFFCSDVAEFLETNSKTPDLIIIDPPRAGLTPSAVAQILKIKAKKIVYVSCNPTSLARDCQMFCADGYKLQTVQPVDMFPQTYHIENVCSLVL